MYNEEKRDEGCDIYDSGWAFPYIADSKARMGWRKHVYLFNREVSKAIHNFHIRLPEAYSESGFKAAIEWETSSRADSSS
jgi:hypothetical protein